MRIHITGGPGSGKSTLARALAQRLELDVFHIDSQALRHVAALGGVQDFDALAAARIAEAVDIASAESWISEGSNVLVAHPFFERADRVVVLYCPWRVASYRILMRHFKANLAGNNQFPGIGNLYRFWRWCSRYYSNRHAPGLNEWGTPATQTTLEELLTPYETKVMRCRTKPEVDATFLLLSQQDRLSDR